MLRESARSQRNDPLAPMLGLISRLIPVFDVEDERKPDLFKAVRTTAFDAFPVLTPLPRARPTQLLRVVREDEGKVYLWFGQRSSSPRGFTLLRPRLFPRQRGARTQ